MLFYKDVLFIHLLTYAFVSRNNDSSVSTAFLRLLGDDFFSYITVRSMFTKS